MATVPLQLQLPGKTKSIIDHAAVTELGIFSLMRRGKQQNDVSPRDELLGTVHWLISFSCVVIGWYSTYANDTLLVVSVLEYLKKTVLLF